MRAGAGERAAGRAPEVRVRIRRLVVDHDALAGAPVEALGRQLQELLARTAPSESSRGALASQVRDAVYAAIVTRLSGRAGGSDASA